METLQSIYDKFMARTSFTLVMLAIAGSMALVLGILAIYGVIPCAVSQRNRHSASPRRPAQRTSRDVRTPRLTLALIGVALGLGAAAALTRLLSSLLFGINPLDPLTYGVGALLLALSAALASHLLARRASAVDPVIALKAE